jgi:phage-related protein
LERAAVWLGENIPVAVEFLKTTFQTVAAVVGPIVETIITIIDTLRARFSSNSNQIGARASALGAQFKGVFEGISGVVSSALELVNALVAKVLPIILRLWEQHGERILNTLNTVWNTVKTVIESVLGIVQGIIGVFIAIVTGDWDKLKESITQIWTSLWDGVTAIIDAALALIDNAIRVGASVIKEAFVFIWDAISGLFDGFVEDATSFGKRIVEGLWNGVKSLAGWLRDRVSSFITDNVPGPIIRALGIGSPAANIIPLGAAVSEGLAVGITDGRPDVRNAADLIAAAAVPSIGGLRSAASNVVPLRPGAPAPGGGLFDGATFVQQGTPERLARETARQIGLEVRAS